MLIEFEIFRRGRGQGHQRRSEEHGYKPLCHAITPLGI
jgi:hypothetical protein